jgi:hypothetical protein
VKVGDLPIFAARFILRTFDAFDDCSDRVVDTV